MKVSLEVPAPAKPLVFSDAVPNHFADGPGMLGHTCQIPNPFSPAVTSESSAGLRRLQSQVTTAKSLQPESAGDEAGGHLPPVAAAHLPDPALHPWPRSRALYGDQE